MAEEYQDEIKCPYCQHVFSESYEYVNDHCEPDEIDCDICEKKFRIEFQRRIEFNTYRLDCGKGKHEWTSKCTSITQKTIDRWDREDCESLKGGKPHDMWIRSCSNCEEKEYWRPDLPLKSKNPWPSTVEAHNR